MGAAASRAARAVPTGWCISGRIRQGAMRRPIPLRIEPAYDRPCDVASFRSPDNPAFLSESRSERGSPRPIPSGPARPVNSADGPTRGSRGGSRNAFLRFPPPEPGPERRIPGAVGQATLRAGIGLDVTARRCASTAEMNPGGKRRVATRVLDRKPAVALGLKGSPSYRRNEVRGFDLIPMGSGPIATACLRVPS